MGRLLLSINFKINLGIIKNFTSQIFDKKNTPGMNNWLDSDYYSDMYGFIYWYDNMWHHNIFNKEIDYIYIYKLIEIEPAIIIGFIEPDISGFIEDNGISNSQTRPLIYNNWVFIYDGYLKNFNKDIKERIDEKYYEYLDTESDYIFYLLLSIYGEIGTNNLALVFEIMFEYLIEYNIEIVGNFILSNSSNTIIIRYIAPNFNAANFPPSLYLNKILLNHDTLLISSEPVRSCYTTINMNSYIVI